MTGYNGLGLSATALASHIAWDPGAVEVARRLAEHLDAPLIASGYSRLVIDCNRPLTSEESITSTSDQRPVGRARCSASAASRRS